MKQGLPSRRSCILASISLLIFWAWISLEYLAIFGDKFTLFQGVGGCNQIQISQRLSSIIFPSSPLSGTLQPDVYGRIKSYKIIFATVTRDNIGTLPNMVKELEELGKLFKSFAFVFAENDSSDGTKEYLNKLAREANYSVVRAGEDFRLKKRPSHGFLAKMRNFYLREIYSTQYGDYDYVLMYDADFEHVVSRKELADSFDRAGWDVIASLGERNGRLYDAFAFRNKQFNTPYVPELYGGDFNKYCHFNLYQEGGPMVAFEDGPLIPVYSGFGGLAIYNKNFLQGLFYNETSEDCEHVSLHEKIRKRGGKIFMNPNMKMKYPSV